MVQRNAPLSETGRERLARRIVIDGWPLRRAAERFQVSPTTAKRWADRCRAAGAAGMADRSSRPHHSPRRIPTRIERRIIKVRVLRRWGRPESRSWALVMCLWVVALRLVPAQPALSWWALRAEGRSKAFRQSQSQGP